MTTQTNDAAAAPPAPPITRASGIGNAGGVAAWMLMAALVLLPSGCGSPVAAKPAPVTSDALRAELNVGYSLLYQQADGIPKMKWILMFKRKPDDLDATTDEMLAYYQQLADTLEAVAARNPALRLDAKTMPDLLADTRKAIGVDMAKDFAPLVGDTGLKFGRELLLMFCNALDEQRHLVGVMIELEPEPALQDFLAKTRTQLEARRNALQVQLNRHYFRQDASG